MNDNSERLGISYQLAANVMNKRQVVDMRTNTHDFLQFVALIQTTIPAFTALCTSFSGILSLLFRIVLIRHIEALALVMHRRWLIQLPKRNSLAVGADGLRSIIEALPELELGIAAVAEVSVEGHPITPS